jgi:hypothetical protein
MAIGRENRPSTGSHKIQNRLIGWTRFEPALGSRKFLRKRDVVPIAVGEQVTVDIVRSDQRHEVLPETDLGPLAAPRRAAPSCVSARGKPSSARRRAAEVYHAFQI